jgi:anaerobic selenocysteine-containing dehydrogenase
MDLPVIRRSVRRRAGLSRWEDGDADRIAGPRGGRTPHRADVSGRHPSNSWRTACRRTTSSLGAGRSSPKRRCSWPSRRRSSPRRPVGNVVLPTAMWAIGRVSAPTPTRPAILKAAHFQPPHEEPNQECPLLLTTGRIVNHFHSRATTGGARQLTGAAPGVWVELSEADAAELEVAEGNLVRVTFPQRLSARHGPYHRHPPGVFAPFPYGSWDQPEGDGPDRRRRPSTSSPSPSRTRSPSSRPTGKPDHRFSRWAEGHRP